MMIALVISYDDQPPTPDAQSIAPPVGSQLLAYVSVAIFGYAATSKLIPTIKVRSRDSDTSKEAPSNENQHRYGIPI